MPVSTSRYAYITCDTEKCVGCKLCELACSYTKSGEFNTYRSRIRTVRLNELMLISIACRTCEDPPCVLACPRNALSQDPETGIIRVDKDLCDGCTWCIEACDFGAIGLNPETKVVEICNLCEEVEEGPQCVKWCPKDALSLSTPDLLAQKARRAVAEQLFQEQ